jgi:UDP:flavonoid glycosyltransferase YjiC (YdhE family)
MAGRTRILFVSESVTLAQVVRLATLARALEPGRYDLHFAATAFPPAVDLAFPVQRWPLWGISAATAQSRLASGKRLYTPRVLRRYVEADLDLIDAVRPDLIVGDLRWSLAVSAPLRRIPLANLINAYWSPHARRDGFPMPDHPVVRWLGERTASKYFPKALPWVFRYFVAPLDRERRRAGLVPLGDLLDVLTFGDFILYADPPEMVDMRELPPNHHFLGAIPWSAQGALPERWGRGGTPVYVTLGSSGAERCVPIVLRALSRLPVDVLLATAARPLAHALPHPLPDNVCAVPFADGRAACARAQVVVHNGGSSTGYQALQAGTPVLGIPSNLDQYLASERIGAQGAGLTLRSGSLTEAAVAIAIQRLLAEAAFRASAERLRQAFSRHDAGANFRDFVARFAPP